MIITYKNNGTIIQDGLKRAPVEGLTLKEFQLQKKIFDFFDTNRDGYIDVDELQSKLKMTTRGPTFEPHMIRRMIHLASSLNNHRGMDDISITNCCHHSFCHRHMCYVLCGVWYIYW
jgi:hypothetical protein